MYMCERGAAVVDENDDGWRTVDDDGECEKDGMRRTEFGVVLKQEAKRRRAWSLLMCGGM